MVAAIALGSNLNSPWGDRRAALEEAIRRMGELGSVHAVSTFYDTEPMGYLDQPRFLNAALLLETELGASGLMLGLLGIEAAMGRVRRVAKGPRVIDLDLLLYGDAVVASDGLTVPHPALGERLFVLQPLAEIAPEMVEPKSGLTIRHMLGLLTADDNGYRAEASGGVVV